MSIDSLAGQFRKAVESKDIESAMTVFSRDVRFSSPVVHASYHGRDALQLILGAVVQVFENFRYDAEFSAPSGHVLLFSASIGDREIQGVDILNSTDGEWIDEFIVMVRPYSGATALRERMADLLSHP